MRRATAAFLGTVAGTSLLVGAKYATASPEATNPTAVGAPIGGDGAGLGTSPSAPAMSGPPSPTAKTRAGRSAATRTSSRPAAATSTKTTAPAPTKTTATSTCTTATGGAVRVSSPGIGSVTVTVKVCGGKISSSSGYMSSSNWDKNTSAIPALNSMAVTYGQTNISKVYYSGCSLTSAAYRSSLSSALSKAG